MKNLLTIALLSLISFGCEAKTDKTITLSKNNTLVLADEVNDETIAFGLKFYTKSLKINLTFGCLRVKDL